MCFWDIIFYYKKGKEKKYIRSHAFVQNGKKKFQAKNFLKTLAELKQIITQWPVKFSRKHYFPIRK